MIDFLASYFFLKRLYILTYKKFHIIAIVIQSKNNFAIHQDKPKN